MYDIGWAMEATLDVDMVLLALSNDNSRIWRISKARGYKRTWKVGWENEGHEGTKGNVDPETRSDEMT